MSAKAAPVKAVVPAKALTPVRTPVLLKACSCGSSAGSGGMCDSCAENAKKKDKTAGMLQRSGTGVSPSSVPPSVHSVLRSPGRPLDGGTQGFMESRFGRDFSGVRVHTDTQAADSARAVNARAWTVGQDIAFARGQYRPHTAEGRGLLAHELAHTVQQSGLQRFPAEVRTGGALEPQLEREAETAARAVMSAPHDAHSSAIPVPSRVGAHTISRAPARCPEEAPAKPLDSLEWSDPPAALVPVGVKKVNKPKPGDDPKIRRFNMGKFPLPPTKGPVRNCWLRRAQAGALEAKYSVAGDPKLGFSQGGQDTIKLRKLWEQKLGWMPDTAPAKWAEIKAKSYDPPTAANGKTCAMDHIIELQVGGSNLPGNIQLLETEKNSSAGSTIRGFLSGKARDISGNFPGLAEVDLYFDDVGEDGTCDSCCDLENTALSLAGTLAADTGAPPEDTIAYPISAGGSERELRVGKKNKKELILGNPWNDPSALIIPGMVLKELDRVNTTKIHVPGDKVVGCIDANGCTDKVLARKKLPFRLQSGGGVELSVGTGGQLKLRTSAVAIPFDFPYLSPGKITKLQYEPGTGLSGEGTITPKAAFLPTLQIKFGPEYLALAVPIDASKLTSKVPIPGFKVKTASIDLALFPEFKASGTIDMIYAPGGKQIGDGQIRLGADTEGLTANATVHVTIPGVENTELTVDYKAGEWTGSLALESSNIKLPYIKSGSVNLSISSKQGLGIDGSVGLVFPGDNTFNVSYKKGGGGWILSGSGTINVPKLKPLTVGASYDGKVLNASLQQKSPFNLFGVSGTINEITFSYNTETEKSTITGKGSAHFEKGKTKGDLNVELQPNYKFSGDGTVSYQLTPEILASATIILDKNEEVTVKGAITVPPYTFLKVKADKFNIFSIDKEFPIPGLSFGPLGLQFKVGATLDADYRIGPGEFVDTTIAGSFKPLSNDPDIKLTLNTMVRIPAHAGITGTISAGIAVSAAIAEASLSLRGTANASVDGGFFLKTGLESKSRFEANADAGIDGKLLIKLGLDAVAEAGINAWGFYKTGVSKTWHLKEWDFDPGLSFVCHVPVHYASDEPFKPPSLSDIQCGRPAIDIAKGLDGASKAAVPKEEPR